MGPSLTVPEISAALGVTEKTVGTWAAQEEWSFLKGSTRQFPLRMLPKRRQMELAAALAPALPRREGEKDALQDLATLKEWQRRVMDARLALFAEFKRIEASRGTSQAVDVFCSRARRGVLPGHLQRLVNVANARGGRNGRAISKTMIFRWKSWEKDGIAAFAPKDGHTEQVPEWAPYFLKCFQRPQKPSIPEAMREMLQVLPTDIIMPSYHQVRRWQRKRSRLDMQRGRHSTGALRRFKGYCRRSTDNLLPLDVVQCDGHSFKSKISNPFHGRPFKPEVCAVIDVKTKMCLGWSAGLAESAHTVADALRHAMTVSEAKPWGGVPAILYTDKGAGNLAHMLNDSVTGVLARAGITHHTGIPGNAQGRGLVEKTNQKLWITAARKLTTFCGAGMDSLEQRRVYLRMDKEVRQTGTCALSELPSWSQFLALCEQSMRDYNNAPHAGLKKIKDAAGRIRYMTPAEAWFTAIREGWQPAMLDPAILDDLFRPQVTRITSRAQVSVFGNVYFEPVLEHYHGEEVVVEYDIHDPRAIRVRDKEQRLICLAQLDRNRRDFFPVAEVERARNKRADGRIKLLRSKIEEVEAERRGILDGEIDDALVIEADIGAVDRVLRLDDGADPDTFAVASIETPETALAPAAKITRIVSTRAERFSALLDDLRATPRPLTAPECEFLDSYYQEEGGRMYLAMVGDIRAEYGIAGETQENEKKLAG